MASDGASPRFSLPKPGVMQVLDPLFRPAALAARALLVERLGAYFRDTPTGRFDSDLVGVRVHGHPIERVAANELPPEQSATADLGGHLEGCRIGFDLGGSDRKPQCHCAP
jgi:hypothetical protein